jgi:hypothetical protein
MLVKSGYYRIDRSKILFEQFEDETVLINTETGFYYSLSQEGSQILRLIDEECSADALLSMLFETTDEFASIAGEISNFLANLANEGIIVPCSVEHKNSAEVLGDKPRCANPAQFKTPVLQRFDDVRELLLIDPVHQVDQEYGWPKALHTINAPGSSKVDT